MSDQQISGQCLSRDLDFFPKKKSYLNFLGSYLQKRGVSINDETCAMRHANGFETGIFHAQNNKSTAPFHHKRCNNFIT